MVDAEPPDRDELPSYLRRKVPGFAESPELGEAPAESLHPNVLGRALGRYLLRLARRSVRREAEPGEEAALDRAYVVLEELAVSEDADVREALVVALDGLHSDDVVVAAAETRLGPRSRALYRRWAV